MRSCPSHSQAMEVYQLKYQLNMQLRVTGKWFLYILKLIPFSSAACILLLLLLVVLVHQIIYTPHTLFRFQFFTDCTEIKSTTGTYYCAVTKRFQVLQSLCKTVKTTQLIPQTKRSTDFLEDGSNHAKCLQNVIEMENKERVLSVTSSLTDSLDVISCRICSIQNKFVKS